MVWYWGEGMWRGERGWGGNSLSRNNPIHNCLLIFVGTSERGGVTGKKKKKRKKQQQKMSVTDRSLLPLDCYIVLGVRCSPIPRIRVTTFTWIGSYLILRYFTVVRWADLINNIPRYHSSFKLCDKSRTEFCWVHISYPPFVIVYRLSQLGVLPVEFLLRGVYISSLPRLIASI